MPYYKFKKNDLFYNVVRTHPTNEFYIYDGKVFHNFKSQISGSHTASVPGVPPGNISLYELNVDRNKDDHTFVPKTKENIDLGNIDSDTVGFGAGINSVIFPFVLKDSDQHITLKHITDTEYNENYDYGEMITGSYPLSASIKRNFYTAQEDANQFSEPEAAFFKGGSNQQFAESTKAPEEITKGDANMDPVLGTTYKRRPYIQALKNTLNYYTYMSDQYAFSSSAPDTWRKDTQELNLISIPSIYYGQSIKRGSVDLKFYSRGKLVGRARDLKRNGELLDVGQFPFSTKSIFFSGHLYSYSTFGYFVDESGTWVASWHHDPMDRLRVPESDTFTNLNTLTFSAWILKVGSRSSRNGTILELGQKLDKLNSVAPRDLLVTKNNEIQFGAGFSTGTAGIWKTNMNVFKSGEWTHIAITYNGGSTSNNPVIYVNGQSVTVNETQTPIGTIAKSLGESTIGKNHEKHYKKADGDIPTSSPFWGYIDEVSVWNAVLTSAQISEIYNSGKVTNLRNHSLYSSNLKAWWRMGENTGKKIPGGVGISNSNNYVITDEMSLNDANMLGFGDFSNITPKSGHTFQNPTGIFPFSAPSTYTSSVDSVTENNLIAGVVMYNEGLVLLTGSWDLDDTLVRGIGTNGANDYPKWTYFGSRLPHASGSNRINELAMESKDDLKDSLSLDDAVFYMAFSGTNFVPTRTMMAHAPKGRLNHSNNPTHVQFNSALFNSTGSLGYFESSKIPIKNIVSSSHQSHSGSFEKRTYISKIGIYDENKNLIAIAKTSSPIRKREIDNLSFKLKLDL